MAEKVVISWEMDAKQAIKAVRAMKGEMDGVPKSTAKADKGISTLHSSLRKLGSLVSGVALVGGMRSVIRTFAAFETATVNVQNITGLTTREMASLAREIRELPPALGTATDLMSGLYQAISAGVPKENAVAFLAENAKAAKGNLADLTITVDASTSVLAAYGLQTSETTSVLDAMTKTVDLGKLTFADLASNIGKGIGIAATAGVTYQELMATMASLTLSGLSVEEAMTGIRNILVTTIKAKPGEMMEKFGVEMSVAAIKAQGFAGYMGSVAEAVRGNEQATAALFPNIRAMNSAMSLASEEGGERFRDILEQINNSTGKVEENFTRMSGTFGAKSAEMAAQMELLKIKIAEDVMPEIVKAMGPVIDALAKMIDIISFKGMNSLEGATDHLASFQAQAVALAQTLKDEYDGVAKGIEAVTGAREMSVQGLVVYLRTLENSRRLNAEQLKLVIAMNKAEDAHTKTIKKKNKEVKVAVVETAKLPPVINKVIAAIEDWTAAANTNSTATLKAGENFYSFHQTFLTAGRSFKNITTSLENYMNGVTNSVQYLGTETAKTTDMMASSFSDLLGRGFMGELETFADMWDAIWADLAKSMTGLLGEAFEDAFSEGGNIFKNLKQGWSNFKVEIEKNPLGAGLAGAGMVYSGMQQGGTGGVIAGALGGMMTGASIGSIVPGIGTAVGAVVGAIVGAATAYFGQSDGARSSVRIAPLGGYASGSGQDLSAGARSLFVKQRIEEYRASVMMMNDVLRLFGDSDLFDLVRLGGTFSFDGSGSLGNVAEIFREKWLPSAMRQMFKKAINRGLGSFGVDAQTRQQLWEEVGELTGTSQIVALESFIGSLVGLSELYDDMNWNAITDESRRDSMQSFLIGMGDILDAVQMQMIGLDSMTLLERADQATTIEQLITSARQAEIQMLMQIDALQDSINRSIDSQIEGLRTGGMSDPQLRDYYGAQIDALMAQLRGGVESPEAIQQIMADLQRYVGAYQGALGDQLYTSTGFGGSYADELIAILEEARGLSNDALEAMRDQIRESNDALVLELQRLIEALTHYGDTIATADQVPPVLDGNIAIDVNVFAEEGFGAWVDARIEQWEWRRGAEEGPN